MSDMDENTDKLAELTNKLNRCNKNIKTIMETLKTIEGKLTEPKKEEKKDDNKERERMNKIFEKRQIGRPVGSWDDKRKQYLEWINTGKITEPKDQTLMYYKIRRDEDTNKYKYWDESEFDYTR